MTTRRTTSSAIALLAASFGAPSTFAHHSLATFDGDRVIKIEGTITAFRWINPHASLKIDGTAEGEAPRSWTVEMNAPNVLMGGGWTRDSLATGDTVTVFVNPPREAVAGADGSVRALYVGIVLADGATLGSVDGREPD